MFEGTVHAREWISAATVTWMINELITSNDSLVSNLTATYEWNIIPVINVDGYEYTWKIDRLWRKTRKPVNRRCKGTDPNRNFDIYHNRTLAFPCSELYPGPRPFSEKETNQFAGFVANLHNLVGYFSFHSYGQLLMMPYGYTNRHLDNYEVLYEIGKKAIKSLSARFGTQYQIGTVNEKIGKIFRLEIYLKNSNNLVELNFNYLNILGVVAGSSVDWVKDKLNSNLTFVYELRGGRYGFELPASQIIENSSEVFDSIVTIMYEAQKKGIA